MSRLTGTTSRAARAATAPPSRLSKPGLSKSANRSVAIHATTGATDSIMGGGYSVVAPNGQLHLPPAALEEEIGRELRCRLPKAGDGERVRWSHTEMAFTMDGMIEYLDQTTVHFSLDSTLAARTTNASLLEPDDVSPGSPRTKNAQGAEIAQDNRLGSEKQELHVRSLDARPLRLSAAPRPSLSVDRGTQTSQAPPRSQTVQTTRCTLAKVQGSTSVCAAGTSRSHEAPHGVARAPGSSPSRPAPTQDPGAARAMDANVVCGAAAGQLGHLAALVDSVRGDSYLAPGAAAQSLSPVDDPQGAGPGDAAARVLERMAMQNVMHDVLMDFKYWEDPSDGVRPREGSLLPLWTLAPATGARQGVTALTWCPDTPDLFAVGHGGFDPAHPIKGAVALHSIRAPDRAEAAFELPSAVLCLAFHPVFSYLLAVGCQNGTLSVFDLRGRLLGRSAMQSSGGKMPVPGDAFKPMYETHLGQGGHWDSLWQVCWRPTPEGGALRLTAVYGDGRITEWTMDRGAVRNENVLMLKQTLSTVGGSDTEDADFPDQQTTGCLCLDFHPTMADTFLVGAEDGQISKCSSTQTTRPLQTFKSHDAAVYSVCWNPCHPRLFLSLAADWTLKLWDTADPQPLTSFDLGAPPGDATWLPQSPTVLVAAAENGRVHVYDVDQTPWRPLCIQKIANKCKLTKVCCNPRHPLLLVGDDRGTVHCLKLSPNLRKSLDDEKWGLGSDALAPGASPRLGPGPSIAAGLPPPSPIDGGLESNEGDEGTVSGTQDGGQKRDASREAATAKLDEVLTELRRVRDSVPVPASR